MDEQLVGYITVAGETIPLVTRRNVVETACLLLTEAARLLSEKSFGSEFDLPEPTADDSPQVPQQPQTVRSQLERLSV